VDRECAAKIDSDLSLNTAMQGGACIISQRSVNGFRVHTALRLSLKPQTLSIAFTTSPGGLAYRLRAPTLPLLPVAPSTTQGPNS